MNYYEHTLITKQDLTDSQNKDLVDKYKDIINNNSGKVLKTEEWGLRSFGHKIKKNKRGFYFHMKFEGIGETIKELEKAGNIDDRLLRFLTVKITKNDLDTSYFEKKPSKDIDINEKKQKK